MAVNQKRSLVIAGFTFQNNDLSDFCGRLFKRISQPFIPKLQGIYLHSFVLIVENLINNTVDLQDSIWRHEQVMWKKVFSIFFSLGQFGLVVKCQTLNLEVIGSNPIGESFFFIVINCF